MAELAGWGVKLPDNHPKSIVHVTELFEGEKPGVFRSVIWVSSEDNYIVVAADDECGWPEELFDLRRCKDFTPFDDSSLWMQWGRLYAQGTADPLGSWHPTGTVFVVMNPTECERPCPRSSVPDFLR